MRQRSGRERKILDARDIVNAHRAEHGGFRPEHQIGNGGFAGLIRNGGVLDRNDAFGNGRTRLFPQSGQINPFDFRPAFQQNLTGPIALVAGSEGSGVSPLVKSLCDGVLSLPMAGGGTGVDSFNVSVATGIILYEIMRQRGTEGSI